MSDGPVWVILPTYQEAAGIALIVEALRRVLRGASPEGFRILVVDDASPDGTGVIADALAASHPEVEVLHRERKEGLGPAYRAGFARALAAGAGLVVEMDADGSHDPEALPALLAPARAGADVVLGSRYVPGGAVRDWSLRRRAISRLACVGARVVLGCPVADLTGGFKCFRAPALRAVRYHEVASKGYAFQIEVTYRALQLGLEVLEVPIEFRDRRLGRSKMSTAIAWEAALRVPALRLASARAGRSCAPAAAAGRGA